LDHVRADGHGIVGVRGAREDPVLVGDHVSVRGDTKSSRAVALSVRRRVADVAVEIVPVDVGPFTKGENATSRDPYDALAEHARALSAPEQAAGIWDVDF
jgi:hypothetical protein